MTLALHGKTRQRQAALLFAGFLAVIAGTLYALTTQGDDAKAASQTFPVSSTSCVDVAATATACSPTLALLNGVGGTVTLDSVWSGEDDDLTVSFDLSSIPSGSTLNSATLTTATTAVFGGPGVYCNLRLGSNAAAESDGAYNTWGLNPGPSVLAVNSLVLLGVGYPNLTNHVQAALGGTFTVRLSVSCNHIPFSAAPAGTNIDQISLSVDWTPPPPSATGTKSSDEASGDDTVDVDEDFNWVVTVTVLDGNTTGHTEISDTIQSPLVIRAATWDLNDGTGSGTLTCPDQTGPDIWCRVNSGAAPGTYVVKIPVEVPTGVQQSVCGNQIDNVARISGPDVVPTPDSSPPSLLLDASVDLNPCPPMRTVRVVKVTGAPDGHGGGTFGGTISPAGVSWSQSLGTTDQATAGTNYQVLAVAQTLTEDSPTGSWFKAGFYVTSLTGACPVVESALYHGTQASIPAEGDYLVCVRNSRAWIEKFDGNDSNVPGDGTYGPIDEFHWVVRVHIEGSPTSDTMQIVDTPADNGSKFYTSPEGVNCSGQSGAYTCDVPNGTGPGTYDVNFHIYLAQGTAPVSEKCGSTTNNAQLKLGERVLSEASDIVAITDCIDLIQICKVWTLDGQGEVAEPGTQTFSFEVSDTEQSQTVQITGVQEDGEPVCKTAIVYRGAVEITELDTPGFVLDGWTLGSGGSIVKPPPYTGTSNSVTLTIPGNCEEPQQEVAPLILSWVQDIAAIVALDPRCTVAFFNHDEDDATSGVRIEKYIDINRDGDADDPGEGLEDDWPITITSNNVGLGIAGSYLTGEDANPTGTLVFDGLVAGDSYGISEGSDPGFVIVKATVNGANMGAVTSLTDIVIPDGGTTVVRFYNSPSGSITVHKNTVNVANGIETPNLNDDDGWRITVDSTECNVHESGMTDGNGNITFSGLEMCDDYVVAEDLSVPGAPGYSSVGGASRTGIQPGFSESALVTFTNEKRSTTAPCPNCSGPGPTTFQATPVATPVTPAASPTTPATPPATATAAPATPTTAASSPTPDGALGGQQPSGVITPVAPSTGDYVSNRDQGVSLLVIFAGAIAIVGGAGALAMGSRR